MRMANQSGMTLVEIVFGMAILSSALIIGSLVFSSIANLQQKGSAQQKVQQTGRYVLDVIEKNIRASDVATLNGNGHNLQLNNTQFTWDSQNELITEDSCVDGDCSTGPAVVYGVSAVTYAIIPASGSKGRQSVQINMTVQQPGTLTTGQSYNLTTVVELRNNNVST